jgi:hypothetical protein
MKFIINNSEAFSRAKANTQQMQVSTASYYCNESRITFLKQGVVIHMIYALPDGSNDIELTIDKSSCDGLTTPKPLNIKALGELAKTIVKSESAEAQKSPSPTLRLDAITANQGVVEMHRTVIDGSGWGDTSAARRNVAGLTAGFLCSKYRDAILQGIVFHDFFSRPDGSPIFDIAIDRSNC